MTAREAKIAIYGAGAMGTILGALLTKGGLQNVDLITRNKAHVEGMKAQGATIVCEAHGGKEIVVKVNAILPDEMQGKYDVIFLMTKQRYNAEILTDLLDFMHEDTVVCTTQNGLPEVSVAEIIGTERTYGAATSYGATFIGGGKVALTSKIEAMSMEVGGYQNDNAFTPLLTEILSYVGKATDNENFVKGTDNLIGARWAKLAINAAFSGLSVVTGMTFGEVAKKHKTRKLALCILRECIDVAKASGVQLAKMQGHDLEKMLGGKTGVKRFIAYMVLPFAMKKHKKLVSGMLKDVQNGRKCEIDFVCGAVVKAGKAVGVETPFNAEVVQLVHAIENGLCEITYKNTDLFWRVLDYAGETL
ncbi:MAG: 2-dehydropantoate 2-reductase [Clostridia bacterium]|nr:2-dehydropantoate 2-reductase [Clostridia bacterium]